SLSSSRNAPSSIHRCTCCAVGRRTTWNGNSLRVKNARRDSRSSPSGSSRVSVIGLVDTAPRLPGRSAAIGAPACPAARRGHRSWVTLGGVDLRIFTEPQQGATYEHQLRVARTAEACGLGVFFRSDHYLAMGSGGVRLRMSTAPHPCATYDRPLRVARTAEACGFGGFFRSDHYLAMGSDGLPGPTDAWVSLAGLARETSTIRLGTLVTSATFRRPGPTAIAVAQVDAMSSGRVELGIGAGWFEEEHAAYGIPFPPVGERFDHLEDSLAVITGMWGTPEGEHFSYDGPTVTVTDSPALPKPVQADPVSGGPPVIIGGRGKRRTPALVARFAA